MFGVVRYPYMPTDVHRAIQHVAKDIGRGETHNKAPLDVYFGTPGVEADDPYFGGVGPGARQLHLLRQLQQRLRPQRYEQADDELRLPSRRSWSRRFTRCIRCSSRCRSRKAGSRARQGRYRLSVRSATRSRRQQGSDARFASARGSWRRRGPLRTRRGTALRRTSSFCSPPDRKSGSTSLRLRCWRRFDRANSTTRPLPGRSPATTAARPPERNAKARCRSPSARHAYAPPVPSTAARPSSLPSRSPQPSSAIPVTAPVPRRSQSWRAIVATGHEPVMPLPRLR